MTTDTKPDLKKIPQRADIEEKYTWNLADIYKDTNAWEASFAESKELIKKISSFAGKLNDDATLYECLEIRNDLSLKLFCLYQYAKLSLDLDSRQSKYQEMTDRAVMLSAEAGAAGSFIEPELLQLTDEELIKLSLQFPEKDKYDFYMKELVRSRQHIRSEEVEELLSLSRIFAEGPEQTFSLLDDADLKYPTIKDENDNEVRLTKQRLARFMESSNPRVRRDANTAFYSVYKDHINTLSATLSTEVNKNIFYTKARRYENALHRALDGDNIPLSVYHALLDTTESKIEGLHKWTALRKKILKLDEIAPYDMICPLFPDYNYEVPYEEAVKKVKIGCQPLGEDYGKRLDQAFSSRWVDVFETEGKTGGAYSWGNFATHPFVLMNYNDTVDNMFTLAHELGHCIHSVLSNETQPFSKSQYSTFVAEVASTLNEGLLLHHLLQEAKSTEEKLFLLNRQIDNTMGTFFNQVMFARFELAIHEIVEQGAALSPDTLNRLYSELLKKYFGPTLTIDPMTPYKWSRVPHFYMTFYVYQYATSYAASQAILKKFIDGEDGIIDRYLELLKSGGKDYPINLLKECGVDMSTPDPVNATIELFAEQVDEVERLTKN